MCERLGMNANTPTNVMFSFAGQARRAHCSTKLHWIERGHPFCAATLADDAQ